MRILLIGDASNFHVALANGLRRLGHTAVVASDGGLWMKTARDIDLSRPLPGKLGGALLYGKVKWLLKSSFKGFDIVALAAPSFMSLRPGRLAEILLILKKNNGAVWLNYLGTDTGYVRNLTGKHPALAYSEFHTPEGLTEYSRSAPARMDEWLGKELSDYSDFFYSNIDGAVSALYEYHKVIEAEYPDIPLFYGGIPIDTGALPAPILTANSPVQVLMAAHKCRVGEKGEDVLLNMLQELKKECGDGMDLYTPERMLYRDFLPVLNKADIVADQLYSYTPATTALMGMAMGTVPVSGGEEEYYRFIGEDTLRPIINANPFDINSIYSQLKEVITHPELLMDLKRQGIEFVRRHNEATVVAKRYLHAWTV